MDDSRLIRVQMEDVLAGTDYQVAAHCRSGEEATRQYAEVKPDLVTAVARPDTPSGNSLLQSAV